MSNNSNYSNKCKYSNCSNKSEYSSNNGINKSNNYCNKSIIIVI